MVNEEELKVGLETDEAKQSFEDEFKEVLGIFSEEKTFKSFWEVLGKAKVDELEKSGTDSWSMTMSAVALGFMYRGVYDFSQELKESC